MLFVYIAFSCFLSQSGIKLGRRANEIFFTHKSNMAIKSNEDSWYFVQFHFANSNKDQMISDLEKQGINLKSTNCISKNLFNLYLTPYQVKYITSKNLGEVHEIESDNKIANTPSKDWNHLTIETVSSQDMIQYYSNKKNLLSNDKCQYSFQSTTKNSFSIKGSQQCLTDLLPTLTNDKRIYAISYDKDAEELNCRATGFVQKNADKASHSIDNNDGSHLISVDRFLNKQGLDGTGVKVLVVDTYLDTNSTYFYDPNHPTVKFNEFTNGHRKIDYVSAIEEWAQMRKNDHGTHTAGSITGKALKDSDSSAYYNGCAPGSRLSFYCDNGRNYPPEEVAKVVDTVKPRLSTNSWGLDYTGPLHDSQWDQIAYERNNTLFLFAAGNSAASGEYEYYYGYQSLRSPGSAKNMLTVGAATSVYVDESSIGTDKKEIYLTDEDDESTHLTKVLKWSLVDYEKNIGMKHLFDSGRLRVSVSRNPDKYENNTVLVIDNREQFESLPRDKPPYFVVTTFDFEVDNFSNYGFSHTFPVMYLDKDLVPKYESNFLESNYRTSKGYSRAEFSSKGTGNLGLMKPDIMCPGVSILSARALPNAPYDQKELTIKHGTSMATPICAGASAIVMQYFQEGKYRNKELTISAPLTRSFMITCSDPTHDKLYPNCEEGHGLLNLGKYIGNGFDTDNSHLLVADNIKLTDGGSRHLMATFSVADTTTEVKVTLSYLDAVLSPDSSAALAVDIDLVVVSPSGKVYRGNQREDGTEEHYSTNEGVIVPQAEVEKGSYEIHVFSAIPSTLENLTDSVYFAVTVYGTLDNGKNGDFLQFKKATKCIPAEHGDCNEETFDNDCYNQYYGRSCQIYAEGLSIYIPRKIIRINPYGIRYFILYYPPQDEHASVTYRVTPVSVFEPKVLGFTHNIRTGGIEAEADVLFTRGGFSATYNYDPNNLPQEEVYMLIMIYNTAPFPTDFVLTADATPHSQSPSSPDQPPTPEQPPETEPVTSPSTQTSVVTSPPSAPVTSEPTQTEVVPTTTSSSSDNVEDKEANKSSKWKRLAIFSAALTIGFALLTIILVILLIVVVARRKKLDDRSESVASLHNPLLS